MFWVSAVDMELYIPYLANRLSTSHTGIDLAEAVIRERRAAFTGKNNCTFEIAALEPYQLA